MQASFLISIISFILFIYVLKLFRTHNCHIFQEMSVPFVFFAFSCRYYVCIFVSHLKCLAMIFLLFFRNLLKKALFIIMIAMFK